MMIIDRLKKCILGIFKKKPESNNEDIVPTINDETSSLKRVEEKCFPFPALYNWSINLIDDDLVEERMPCVYGPPLWYNENGSLDRRISEAKHFIDETGEIRKRNMQRDDLQRRLQYSINEPIAKVHGPYPLI